MNRKKNYREGSWSTKNARMRDSNGTFRGKAHDSVRAGSLALSEARDFSEIEGRSLGIKVIRELVAKAGKAAASEATAIGMPRVFAKDGQIIRRYADGQFDVISTARERKGEVYFVRNDKVGVLHARKK
jgi:hypothetical protein